MVLRQRVWIDADVQGVLVGRIVIYWTVAVLYFGLGSICFQYYQHPEWTFVEHVSSLYSQIWPWLPSIVLFLPLVVFDVVRLSNFFAGPIYRLRMHLMELTADADCRPLTFREEDYWQDLVEPINLLQNEILELRRELAASQVAERKSKPSRIAAAIEASAPVVPATETAAQTPAGVASE